MADVTAKPLAGRYPEELEERVVVDGANLNVRPIRTSDVAAEADFVRGLSEDSAHSRFMMTVHELPDDLLYRFTHVDYDRSMAFVASKAAPAAEIIIGISRSEGDEDHRDCEFAVTVADAWQGRGLGVLLMQRLIAYATDAGYQRMIGYVLASNRAMLRLSLKLGFTATRAPGDPTVDVVILPLVPHADTVPVEGRISRLQGPGSGRPPVSQ